MIAGWSAGTVAGSTNLVGSRAQDADTGGIDEVDFVKRRYPQKNFADTYACLPCVATVTPNASSFDLFLSARFLYAT